MSEVYKYMNNPFGLIIGISLLILIIAIGISLMKGQKWGMNVIRAFGFMLFFISIGFISVLVVHFILGK